MLMTSPEQSRISSGKNDTVLKKTEQVEVLYGELGVLAYDAIEDKVQCHICGLWFRSSAAHVWQRHGWTADYYREEFGLKRGQSLICQGTRELLGEINRRLGNWHHLVSQTMSTDELKDFMKNINRGGYQLRQQTLLLQSERLKQNNPMNNPESLKRRTATLHKTWYGTDRMRAHSRRNLAAGMRTIRERNLRERKYTCPCGETFPIREDERHHRAECPIALQQKKKRGPKRKR